MSVFSGFLLTAILSGLLFQPLWGAPTKTCTPAECESVTECYQSTSANALVDYNYGYGDCETYCANIDQNQWKYVQAQDDEFYCDIDEVVVCQDFDSLDSDVDVNTAGSKYCNDGLYNSWYWSCYCYYDWCNNDNSKETQSSRTGSNSCNRYCGVSTDNYNNCGEYWDQTATLDSLYSSTDNKILFSNQDIYERNQFCSREEDDCLKANVCATDSEWENESLYACGNCDQCATSYDWCEYDAPCNIDSKGCGCY